MKLTADLIGGILKPIGDLVDNLHTSVEEKQKLQNEVQKSLVELTRSAFDYEQSLFQAQSAIIIAEASGKHWLQSNWRPLTMVTFVGMFVWNWVFAPIWGHTIDYPTWVGTAYTVGLGGYVAGRSAEKIAKTVSLNSQMLKLPGEDRKNTRAMRKLLKQAKSPEERAQILGMIED